MLSTLNQSQNGIVKINGFQDYLSEKLSYNKLTTFQPNKTLPIHRWFPYLQGYSSQIVEELIRVTNVKKGETILDPFCGVGTTLVSCKMKGINSIGFDISPLSVFVSQVKVKDTYDIISIKKYLNKIIETKIEYHEPPPHPIFYKGIPKERVNEILSLKEAILLIEQKSERDFLLLALLSIISDVSLIKRDGAHYRFVDKPKTNDTIKTFQNQVNLMIADIEQKKILSNTKDVNTTVKLGDARELELENNSVDGIITSPPYLNRDNYIAQYKIELFLMGFISNMKEYRDLTHRTLRSHVEAKKLHEYSNEPIIEEVEEIIDEISKRPINNPCNIDMIKGYFEDMNIVIREMKRCLKTGCNISLVVGNSCWSGVLVEVDKILAKICRNNNLKIEKILVTRYKLNSAQQINKYGRIPVRESIVIVKKGE